MPFTLMLILAPMKVIQLPKIEQPLTFLMTTTDCKKRNSNKKEDRKGRKKNRKEKEENEKEKSNLVKGSIIRTKRRTKVCKKGNEKRSKTK